MLASLPVGQRSPMARTRVAWRSRTRRWPILVEVSAAATTEVAGRGADSTVRWYWRRPPEHPSADRARLPGAVPTAWVVRGRREPMVPVVPVGLLSGGSASRRGTRTHRCGCRRPSGRRGHGCRGEAGTAFGAERCSQWVRGPTGGTGDGFGHWLAFLAGERGHSAPFGHRRVPSSVPSASRAGAGSRGTARSR
jgi:hypothetical protein